MRESFRAAWCLQQSRQRPLIFGTRKLFREQGTGQRDLAASPDAAHRHYIEKGIVMRAQLASWVCTGIVLLGLFLLTQGARPVDGDEATAANIEVWYHSPFAHVHQVAMYLAV